MTRVASAVTAPGAGTLDGVVAEVGQAQVAKQQAAVGVRVGAHAALPSGAQLGQLGPEPAGVVEQLLGPVALHPLFEDADVARVVVHLAHRHLVRAPVVLAFACRRSPSGQVQPLGERRTIMGQRGRALKPSRRASAWMRWISATTASSVAAISWCIASGSWPSTKYGV